MAGHTEIGLCSHAHIAAIPGADGHQRASLQREDTSGPSVSRCPAGVQPGNNIRDGALSSGSSILLVGRKKSTTEPCVLHFHFTTVP